MARFLMVVLVVYALLAGAFAFRGGPLLAPAAVPGERLAMTPRSATRSPTRATPARRASRPEIPRQPMRRPPLPVTSPMSDAFLHTVAARLVVRGESRWVVVRTSERGDEATVVSAPDGRIPAFASADSARAWAERTMPAPKLSPEEARFLTGLARRLERAGVFDGDLDQAYAWAAAPSREGLTADTLLAGWALLAMASELPAVTPGDPMGIAQARGEAGRTTLTDDEELTLAMAKVDLVVRLAQRERKRLGDPLVAQWPPAPYWSDADAARVAKAMRPAIVGLAGRLTDDLDGVARALTSASR